MVGIFDAFEVYNKKKHSSNPHMFGSASNTGGTKTDYVYSSEYRAPKKNKLTKDEILVQDNEHADGAKATLAENATQAGMPNMVDLSKLSQHELESLMKNLRKGEPNNRVNF
ncbi:LAQU0S01e12244g1_1 [Lachancea quebecensis]|uniref:Stationary phase protein 4 n=1 Tax=Lachancea quebecensis TaxID=1654605 RepID=A0A0P1KLU5_9SACH|nr:LAQU0S01e12244g1_1 [Lachancea quebecensis]